MLYAGADEMLVFAPPEDAFEIACAIRSSFESKRADIARATAMPMIARITISVSLQYSHIRAPLRWAIHESQALLDDVAKEAAGRDALAISLFDVDGPRSRWAAQWGSMQIGAFGLALGMALDRYDWLWSNEFYHRLADTLRTFLVPSRHADYPALVEYLSPVERRAGRPSERDTPLVNSLVDQCVELKAGSPDKGTAEALLSLLTPFDPRPGTVQKNVGHVILAPMDILRVLRSSWCKDGKGYAPIATASSGAEATA